MSFANPNVGPQWDRSRGASVFESTSYQPDFYEGALPITDEATAQEVNRRELEVHDVLHRLQNVQQANSSLFGWRGLFGTGVVDKIALRQTQIAETKKRYAREHQSEDEEGEYEDDILLNSRLAIVGPSLSSAGWLMSPSLQGGQTKTGAPSTSLSDANAFSEISINRLKAQADADPAGFRRQWAERNLTHLRRLLYRSHLTTAPLSPRSMVLPTRLQRPLHMIDSSSYGGGNGAAAITWISPVLKQNRQGKVQQRLLFLTRTHLYSCLMAEGNVQRCVSLELISHVHVHVPQQCKNQSGAGGGGVRVPVVGDPPASSTTAWARAATNAIPSQLLSSEACTSGIYSKDLLARYPWGGSDASAITAAAVRTMQNTSGPAAWAATVGGAQSGPSSPTRATGGGGGGRGPPGGGGGLAVPDSTDLADYPCEVMIFVPQEYDFHFFLKEATFGHFINALKECHFSLQYGTEKLNEAQEVDRALQREHSKIESECRKYIALGTYPPGSSTAQQIALGQTYSRTRQVSALGEEDGYGGVFDDGVGLTSPIFLGGADDSKFQLDSSTWTVTSPADVFVPGLGGKPPAELYAVWEERLLALCKRASRLFSEDVLSSTPTLIPKLRVTDYPTPLSKVAALVKSVRLEKPPTFERRAFAPLVVPHTKLMVPLRPKRHPPPPPPQIQAPIGAASSSTQGDVNDSFQLDSLGEESASATFLRNSSVFSPAAPPALYAKPASKAIPPNEMYTVDVEDYNDEELVAYLAAAVRAEEKREQKRRSEYRARLDDASNRQTLTQPAAVVDEGHEEGSTVLPKKSSGSATLPPTPPATTDCSSPLSNDKNGAMSPSRSHDDTATSQPLVGVDPVDRSLQRLIASYDTRSGCLKERIQVLRGEVDRLSLDNAQLLWMLPREQQRTFSKDKKGRRLELAAANEAALTEIVASSSKARDGGQQQLSSTTVPGSGPADLVDEEERRQLLDALDRRDKALREIAEQLDGEASLLWATNVELTGLLGRGGRVPQGVQ